MNLKRFTARTAREALVLVRESLGDDAVVLSTKPCADGVEVLAMAPEGMAQVQRMANAVGAPALTSMPPSIPRAAPSIALTTAPAAATATGTGWSLAERNAARTDPPLATTAVTDDVTRLSMSTLSFQDYVRERMLRRREDVQVPKAAAAASAVSAMHAIPATHAPQPAVAPTRSSVLEQRMAERPAAPPARAQRQAPLLHETLNAYDGPATLEAAPEPSAVPAPVPAPVPVSAGVAAPRPSKLPKVSSLTAAAALPGLADEWPAAAAATNSQSQSRRDQQDMMDELRSMKGLIEERFGALAYMEKLQRQPAQARLTQKLLEGGFSPALIRKIGDSLSTDTPDETAWAASVLERNLLTAEADAPLEDQGGVYALVGATGVGKTTTTAKIAAAFATKYGASNLGLITLDAYRLGAHEQLRAYGRILGVPVHTAHDRASLEDLLELLAGKKMVLIDTAGMAQRDARTRELLDMLSHRAIKKLLVINAASQGETIEDVLISYCAATCAGVVLSKMDEAVKLGPALDALIRHRLKLIGVANGQRVPEDWHRLSASALVHRAMRAIGGSAYKLDASEVSLIFTAPMSAAASPRAAAHV